MRFNGAVYDPALDDKRLTKQMGKVYSLMIDGHWRTLAEVSTTISTTIREPEASISAQLRHLRKPRFGSYQVNKRPRGTREHGLFEYQLLRPEPQKDLFEGVA